jgi:formylglycine-generating enzyme required for sulfatase activity
MEGFDGMRRIGGGGFAMGSERFYPEERPLRRVRVDAFCGLPAMTGPVA